MNTREPIKAAMSAAPVTRQPDQRGERGRLRIMRQTVLENLPRLESTTWRRHRLRITADTVLLAGALDILPSVDGAREALVATATLLLGEEYTAGFCDGFNCSPASRRSTRRYVEGLDDGNLVGNAVRRSASKVEF